MATEKKLRIPKPAAKSLKKFRATTILSKKDKAKNRRTKIAKKQNKL